MNLTTPLLKGIIRGTELPGDSVISPLQKVDRRGRRPHRHRRPTGRPNGRPM